MPAPLTFVAAAAPIWLIVAGTFHWLRAQEPGAAIGWATALTLVRGALIGALAGCIPLPAHGWVAWAPAIFYTTAAVCDLFDGYLARRRDEVTALGGRLDVAMDALGLVIAPLAGVVLGRLPVWYLLLGAAYYLFHAGLWLRRRRGLVLHTDRLRANPHARMFAGYQMGLVATALFPLLRPPGTLIAATMFMIPTLALFARDWLLVTGRLAPAGARRDRALASARDILQTALPVLRAAVAGGLMALIARKQLPPALALFATFIAMGAVTRLSAFAAGVALTLVLQGQTQIDALALATFVATMMVLLAGGGRWALWNPEDRWLFMRAGQRPPRAADLRAPSVGM